MLRSKTYSAKPSDVTRQWYLVDAKDVALGRLSTVVATRLSGKHKPTYTPHVDGGDGVVVINAAKVKLTGNKPVVKTYYRHSGHPGALKETTFNEQMAKRPEFVIENAVRGMLPKNKLADDMLKRLKVYTGAKHEQEAQQPQSLEVK